MVQCFADSLGIRVFDISCFSRNEKLDFATVQLFVGLVLGLQQTNLA